MDRNGRALPHNCVEALIDAGEVSRSEVERTGGALGGRPVPDQKDGLLTPPLCGSWKNFANLRGRFSKIDIHFGTRTRTTNSGVNFAGNFLSSLRILDLEDLDGLQRSVLEAFARGVDY